MLRRNWQNTHHICKAKRNIIQYYISSKKNTIKFLVYLSFFIPFHFLPNARDFYLYLILCGKIEFSMFCKMDEVLAVNLISKLFSLWLCEFKAENINVKAKSFSLNSPASHCNHHPLHRIHRKLAMYYCYNLMGYCVVVGYFFEANEIFRIHQQIYNF